MAAIGIRKHAILKRQYRRAVAATPDFHQRDGIGQWAVLRAEVERDLSPEGVKLLGIMDSREQRREEVLASLEDARQAAAR
jgi:hypothetical protein